jgi:acyl-coenzyme A thioesterase PaaI-like protein
MTNNTPAVTSTSTTTQIISQPNNIIDIVDLLNKSIAKPNPANPLMSYLNGSVVSFDKINETVILKFPNVAKHFGQGRSVQGGILATFLDAGAAFLMLCLSNGEHTISTLEQKVTYFAPVPTNVDVYIVAKLLKRGKSVGFFDAELFIGPPTLTSKPAAKASQTGLIVDSMKRKAVSSSSSSNQKNNNINTNESKL